MTRCEPPAAGVGGGGAPVSHVSRIRSVAFALTSTCPAAPSNVLHGMPVEALDRGQAGAGIALRALIALRAGRARRRRPARALRDRPSAPARPTTGAPRSSGRRRRRRRCARARAGCRGRRRSCWGRSAPRSRSLRWRRARPQRRPRAPRCVGSLDPPSVGGRPSEVAPRAPRRPVSVQDTRALTTRLLEPSCGSFVIALRQRSPGRRGVRRRSRTARSRPARPTRSTAPSSASAFSAVTATWCRSTSKKLPQLDAVVAAAEAVGAEHGIAAGDEGPDLVGERPHVVGRGDERPGPAGERRSRPRTCAAPRSGGGGSSAPPRGPRGEAP